MKTLAGRKFNVHGAIWHVMYTDEEQPDQWMCWDRQFGISRTFPEYEIVPNLLKENKIAKWLAGVYDQNPILQGILAILGIGLLIGIFPWILLVFMMLTGGPSL